MSVYRIEANRLRTVKILSVKTETPTVKTFTFKDKECAKAKPGQFLMLWIPGIDEIPLSILNTEKAGSVSVAVKRVGEATEALHAKKQEETIGLRGPFGNSLSVTRRRALLVGGGTGIAPLFLLTKALASASNPVLILGAKTKAELLYVNQLKKMLRQKHGRLITSTEDGTCGITGLCTEPLEELLTKERFDLIYACGPERMTLKVFELAQKYGVGLEASLERLMRCAIGLCGSCVIGQYRVCRDGPVFTSEQLREVKTEFGKSKLDAEGKRVRLE